MGRFHSFRSLFGLGLATFIAACSRRYLRFIRDRRGVAQLVCHWWIAASVASGRLLFFCVEAGIIPLLNHEITWSNHRAALDAGSALLLHIKRH